MPGSPSPVACLLLTFGLILGCLWPCALCAADAPAAEKDRVIDSDAAVRFINEQIRQGWRDAEMTPTDAASDGQWCRRVYLDIIGRIPAIDETVRFVEDRAKDKRLHLVQRLLSSEYRDEYARNWTGVWTNLLIGRSVNGDRRGLVNRAGLETYLYEAFQRNKSYDTLVSELIAANGANAPGSEDFNGAVNFLLDNLQDKATPATAKTARLFLGVQVQCTQCHDHPFNTWKQDQFWGLNAFFRQARALRTFEDTRVVSARLEDEDFAGESGNPQTGEIYFERRNGTLIAVLEPTFIDGTKIKPSGYVQDVNRRDALAALVVKSPQMPLAIVNRMWAYFFGHGFTRPVDDMGPHNPPSHPALLQGLADQFVASGYDLRQLIRWIVLSEPYSLSSRAARHNQQDEPSLGQKPLFSHFYLRQMRPEQLYDSLVTATEAAGQRSQEGDERRRAWLSQFTIAFGTDENDETSTFNGTIPQALLLMNGELTNQALSTQSGSFLAQVAGESATDREKMNKLYLAALSRLPTRDELATAQQIWLEHRGDTAAALRDIWWALLNSNEFILNH
jgi:hypothetical protein